jgi:hypothetical protein
MALQSSGAIKFSEIQTEFGGTNPVSISEYYRGGSLVPNHPNNTNIPTSGVIKLSNFYNTSYRYIVTITITTSSNDVSLTSLLNPTTYNVPYDVNLVINNGVVIGSTSTSTPALDIGTGWNAGTIITINNYGSIVGKGGAGGAGADAYQSVPYAFPGANGASGGPGLQIPNPTSTTVNLNNYGTIGGGGGGGSGGGSGVNAGVAYYGAGGGGGGGAGSGAAGAGGITAGSYGSVQVGTNGSAGTSTAGGSGGAGYSGLGSGGGGGSGGGLGQNGFEGQSGCGSLASGAGGGPGAGGYSIVGYNWLSSVVNSGNIAGTTTSYPASLPAIIARSNSYNYPSCPYAFETVQYWNGAANPSYNPGDGGGGGDNGDD